MNTSKIKEKEALPRAPQSLDEFKKILLETSTEDYVSNYILERVPWIFTSRGQYNKWKRRLAENIDVDPFSIVVVGSSCTEYSLSPNKGFSRFSTGSDIDIAVVSPDHFNQAWKWLRSPETKTKFAENSKKIMLRSHEEGLVFNGTIATNRILPHLPYGARWSRGLRIASNTEPTIGRSIKTRVYKDYEALREYHEKNVMEIKNKLLQE